MPRLADILLRLAVAFAFLYPPIAALLDPVSWLSYFPPFMRGVVPDLVLLHGFGLVEVVLALWILSGWKVQHPAALCALILLAIVGFDYQNFDVLFRDISIALASSSLAAAYYLRGRMSIS